MGQARIRKAVVAGVLGKLAQIHKGLTQGEEIQPSNGFLTLSEADIVGLLEGPEGANGEYAAALRAKEGSHEAQGARLAFDSLLASIGGSTERADDIAMLAAVQIETAQLDAVVEFHDLGPFEEVVAAALKVPREAITAYGRVLDMERGQGLGSLAFELAETFSPRDEVRGKTLRFDDAKPAGAQVVRLLAVKVAGGLGRAEPFWQQLDEPALVAPAKYMVEDFEGNTQECVASLRIWGVELPYTAVQEYESLEGRLDLARVLHSRGLGAQSVLVECAQWENERGQAEYGVVVRLLGKETQTEVGTVWIYEGMSKTVAQECAQCVVALLKSLGV